jgi:hypothetical protein
VLAKNPIVMFIVLCVAGCVHKMVKPDIRLEQKMTCPKIFIFQPILQFQKHFHDTKANAVKLSTFQ